MTTRAEKEYMGRVACKNNFATKHSCLKIWTLRRKFMNKCSVDGCDKAHYAKGLCSKHYQRVKATGEINLTEFPKTCSVIRCGGEVHGKGLCVKHYTRLIRHGTIETKIVVGNDELRLLENSHIDENGCRVWDKFKKNGYGVTLLNGKLEQAHRASWMVFVGSIPDGMQLNHNCHNKACINIEHLYVGTQKENVKDMDVAGRRNKPVGERAGLAKLNESQVVAIRSDSRTNSAVAKEYNVSQTLVSAIRLRKIWRHLIE